MIPFITRRHTSFARAQRNADANFTCPASDGVGHHAIRDDRREESRKDAEKSGKRSHEAALPCRFIELLFRSSRRKPEALYQVSEIHA
jgi:hypothetical protein